MNGKRVFDTHYDVATGTIQKAIGDYYESLDLDREDPQASAEIQRRNQIALEAERLANLPEIRTILDQLDTGEIDPNSEEGRIGTLLNRLIRDGGTRVVESFRKLAAGERATEE